VFALTCTCTGSNLTELARLDNKTSEHVTIKFENSILRGVLVDNHRLVFVKVKFGSVWEAQAITQVVTIKVTQDDFHECRVYAVDPNKQRRIEEKTGTIKRVWSRAGGYATFELEIRKKKDPPQFFGPLTEAKTKAQEQYLKRKRG